MKSVWSTAYTLKIEELTEMLEAEHTGGCDQSTCDISAAFQHGYALWSMYLFDSCGAASDEFNKLYASLPKRFMKDAEAERKAFIKDVEHVECPHCNAVVWDPEWVTNNGMVYCDSCGKTFEEVAE